MSRDAVNDFWVWWATVRDDVARAFDAHAELGDDVLGAVQERVEAIHPDLDWEFGSGKRSRHYLCVSAHGDPALRVAAERWRRRAPAADETWEFYPARPASGDLSGVEVTFGTGPERSGSPVKLGELTFDVEVDEHREVVDVRAHHPSFATADADARLRVVLLGLDGLLGEDDVERWIGKIEASEDAGAGPASTGDLARVVSELAARATGSRWALLAGRGGTATAVVNVAVKPIDHMLLDMHVEVRVHVRDPDPRGLPSGDEADVLHEADEELVVALGEHAVLVGHECRDGLYVIHLHVAESGPARGILDRWIQRHPDRTVDVEVAMDPGWSVMDRW